MSEDGNTIIISEYNVETETRGKTCYIDIPSLTFRYDEYKPLEKLFNKENIKGYIYPGVKISQMKYDNLGIAFPFGDIPEPSPETMQKLNELIK